MVIIVFRTMPLTAIAALVLLSLAAPSSAQQTPAAPAGTDTVVTANGDRLSGEIKGLTRGRLSFDTKSMGIVSIKWTHVVEVASVTRLEIETSAGERLLGTLTPVGPGRVRINGSADGRIVDVGSVVQMVPIKASFWSRLDGSLNLGGNYTQSSGIAQVSLTSTTTGRRPSFEWRAYVDSYVTLEKDNRTTERLNAQFSYSRNLSRRWMLFGMAQVERNPDLGFTVRSTLGGGAARTLVRSNKSMLQAGAGIAWAREIPVDGGGETQALAKFLLSHSYFLYDSPKTSLDTTIVATPILNQARRWRLDVNSSITRELFKDFTVSFGITESFDSRPSSGSRKNDLAAKLSVGFTY